MREKKMIHGLGMGFNVREADPKPEHAAKPNEGAPTTPSYTGHARKYEESTSLKSRLAPFARNISAGLDNDFTLSRLNDAVLMGQLTNDEANRIAKTLGLRGDK